MSLYLFLDLASISLPLLFSFHPKIRFYKKWAAFVPALLIVGGIYLTWDIIFTEIGIWRFNPRYLSGVYFLELPLEEWLFFLCIPYACVFTHYVIQERLPSWKISEATYRLISYVLIILLSLVTLIFIDRWYTAVNSLVTIIFIALTLRWRPSILSTFYVSFLFLVIPFLLVNGVLTGSFIEDEVVWYNSAEQIGIRIFTIPVEDVFYAMGLILGTIMFMEWRPFQKKSA